MESQALLGKEEMKVIGQTKNLLEELLETMDILADDEMMSQLRESEKDAKAGRVYDLGTI
ncbi:MAG: hypothetical protein KKA90_04295 [Nanoarchaeota archaeon]|nr:hypothetical protein [Nanoarchaeota archaeon]